MSNLSESVTALERLDVADCEDAFQVHLHQQRYEFTLGRVGPSDRTLEVGTGLGAFSEILSRKVEYYRGVEYDKETCTAAKRRVPSPDWVVEGDAQALDFESNSFDTLVCLEVLEHLPDYRMALDEFVRVLKPGGRLIASIPHVKVGGPSLVNPHHLYEPGEDEFKSELNQRFGDVEVYYQRYTESAFETIARKLRFRKILGLDKQYEEMCLGVPQQMKRVVLDKVRKGMFLGLTFVATMRDS